MDTLMVEMLLVLLQWGSVLQSPVFVLLLALLAIWALVCLYLYAKKIDPYLSKTGEEAVLQEAANVNYTPGLNGSDGGGLIGEIEQPLTAINMLADLTLSRMDRPATRDRARQIEANLRDIMKECQYCFDLIRDGVNEKEAEQGVEVNNINAIIIEALNDTMYMYRHHNVVIRHRLEYNLPAVRVKSRQIYQVLSSLYIDALESMNSSTENVLKVRSSNSNGGISIEVASNGRLVQYEPDGLIKTPVNSTRNMGIGFASCQEILKAHKGTLSHINDADGRSTFKVFIPYE